MRTCRNCGCSLRYNPAKHVRRQSTRYCSLACMRAKPPKMWEAEQAWGKRADEIILECLGRGMSLTAVAGVMGVRRKALYRWLEILGIRRETRWVRREA